MRIYGIFDNERSKFVYIGKTKNKNDFLPHGRHIVKLFKKYPSRFEYKIIEIVEEELLLNEKEIFYIKFYNTFTDTTCFNFTEGGDGGNTTKKMTSEQVQLKKKKELLTKQQNPEIMKAAAIKARETFLLRPAEERDAINRNRIKKSLEAKQLKKLSLTSDEKNMRKQHHSNIVRSIHQLRTEEQKKQINDKISNTLKKELYTLINKQSGEIKTLYFVEWKKQYKVDVYHLTRGLQKSSHGWAIL